MEMCDLQLRLNVHREVLTHFISMTEKTLPVMNIRRGMVRMRTKGRAREKGLIFTIHRMARHTSWIRVKRCIRSVLTCTNQTEEGVSRGSLTNMKMHKMLIYVMAIYRDIVFG